MGIAYNDDHEVAYRCAALEQNRCHAENCPLRDGRTYSSVVREQLDQVEDEEDAWGGNVQFNCRVQIHLGRTGSKVSLHEPRYQRDRGQNVAKLTVADEVHRHGHGDSVFPSFYDLTEGLHPCQDENQRVHKDDRDASNENHC